MVMNKNVKKDIAIAIRILQKAGAQEVYVFGSVGQGTERPGSDLDLAVKGLPPEKFFQTMGNMAFNISRNFDLVDLDEKTPFTEYLERRGGLIRVA